MSGIKLRLRSRRYAVAALSFAVVFGSAAASASAALTQVSSDPYTNTSSYHKTQLEPDTFAAGSTLVSTFQSGRFKNGGASNVGWGTTTNAGSSYTHGFLPATTVYSTPAGPYRRATDPAAAYDAKHNVWLINSLGLTQTSVGAIIGKGVIVNRSIDGGVTFGSPVTVALAGSGQNLDKNWIVCDDTATSPHYGNCYVEWDDNGHGNQLHMAFSSDGGVSWTQSTVPAVGVIGGQPLVQPNGNVVMPIDDAFESSVQSFVSTNGGVSYSGPFAVATITSHTDAGKLRSGPLPTAEVDATGKVYVAWEDCRFISGCSANDIVYSTSSNGTTWSAVTRVPINSTTSGVDHFIPGLAVDRSTSGSATKLGLTYYFYPKTSCTTSTCQLDVGFVGSADGGATWTAPTQLAGPMKLNSLPLTSQGYMVGDYMSTSFVTGGAGDAALSVFAVGFPVAGKTCNVGNIASCNEPMEAPSSPLPAAAVRAARAAVAAPVKSRQSDHARSKVALTVR
jgi:hypothetical protein